MTWVALEDILVSQLQKDKYYAILFTQGPPK